MHYQTPAVYPASRFPAKALPIKNTTVQANIADKQMTTDLANLQRIVEYFNQITPDESHFPGAYGSTAI